MKNGKIHKKDMIPEDIKAPKDVVDKINFVKAKPVEGIKLDINKKKKEMSDGLHWDVNPKMLSLKDIFDRPGRRHINIKEVTKGTIKKVKDLK